jgi:[acyl-carrier-protein] S-malonyltransferase
MGKDLSLSIPQIKQELSTITKSLGYDLSTYMFEGPKNKLFPPITSATPTLFIEVSMALSLAIANSLKGAGITPDAVAGRSMGEYSAYAFAEAFDIPICFLLARTVIVYGRIDCMKTPGSLVTIYGLNLKEIEEVIDNVLKNETGKCEIAIFYDKPKICALGISNSLIKSLQNQISKYDHRLTISKEVGAFHTTILNNCVKNNLNFFKSINFKKPKYPIYANATGETQNSIKKLKTELLEGTNHRVKWQETVENMLQDGIRIFIEMAPGAMLTEFICDMPKDAIILRTDTPENYKKTLIFLKENSIA